MPAVMGYIFVTKQLKFQKMIIKLKINGNLPCVVSMKDDNAVVSKSMDYHVINFKLKHYKYRHLTS
jgi:hypothetical protein